MNRLENNVNLAPLSEQSSTCSDDVPPILSPRDKRAHSLHIDRSKKPRGCVYVIEAVGLSLFKIGMASDFASRYATYKTECPVECRPILVATMPALIVSTVEAALHLRFADKRAKGEWFWLKPPDLNKLAAVIRESAAVASDRTGQSSSDPLLEQRVDRRLMKIQQASVTPLREKILDLVIDAQSRHEAIDVTDIVDAIDRRPHNVHECVRDLISDGQIAVVSPLRHPEDGSIWLRSYKQTKLIIPDETCDWELTNCGHEILVSEPLGEFVPEFFGRQR